MPAHNKVKHLVVDTSAFIKNLPLQEYAEHVYTTQAVIDEITSKRQLRNLVVLPYDLKIKDVFTDNVKFVTEFSKKTGDYPSLSAVDIQVMALSYQLEKEYIGTDHLSSQPRVLKVANFTEDVPAICRNNPGFYVPTSKKKDPFDDQEEEQEEQDVYILGKDGRESDEDQHKQRIREGTRSEQQEDDVSNMKEIIESPSVKRDEFPHSCRPASVTNLHEDTLKELEDDLSKMFPGKSQWEDKPEPREPTAGDNALGSPENGADNIEGVGEVNYDCNTTSDDDDDDDEDDDDIWDDDSWITPDNLKAAQLEVGSADVEDAPVEVACITGDFAMQNVLRQLGLQVLAFDGRAIRTLRTYILRCYGCFKTTSKMELLFCPHCGYKTLRRAAVVLRPDGTEEILVSFRRPPTGRGKRFSLPKPQGGKHANNPLLCPDQRLPLQHISKLARTKNNPLDPDYIAGFSPFVMRDVNSKSAMLGIKNAGEVKNWMCRNPNEVRKKGRKRRN